MMLRIFCFILVLTVSCAFVDGKEVLPESFAGYSREELVNENGKLGAVFHPKEIRFERLRKSKDNLDELRFYIGKNRYSVMFVSGPSDGPLFSLAVNRKGIEVKGIIGAEKIYIASTGAVYAESSFGYFFNVKRKFVVTESEIVEEKQPFYLIDEVCRVNSAVTLYSGRCGTGNVVAVIPKDSNVKVLLAEGYESQTCTGGQENILVSTPFGLVGWVASVPGHKVYGSSPQIDCLRYDSP